MYPSRHVQNNAPAADSAYWCVLWAGRGWTLIFFFFPGGGLRVIKSVGAHLSLNYWENILKWNGFCIVKDGKSMRPARDLGVRVWKWRWRVLEDSAWWQTARRSTVSLGSWSLSSIQSLLWGSRVGPACVFQAVSSVLLRTDWCKSIGP